MKRVINIILFIIILIWLLATLLYCTAHKPRYTHPTEKPAL